MSKGQSYKKLRMGIGAGLFIPPATGYKNGVVVFIEPSYRLRDNGSVGFRYEAAVNQNISIISYSINGQYNFSTHNGKMRPFVGLGTGLFITEYSYLNVVNPNLTTATAKQTLGFYPRIGVDFNQHFSLSLDWNIAFGSTVSYIEYPMALGPVTIKTANVNPEYIALRGSFILGGGKIK